MTWGVFKLDYISIFLFQSTLRSRSDKRTYVHIPISIHAPSITERHEVTYHFNFMFQPTPQDVTMSNIIQV